MSAPPRRRSSRLRTPAKSLSHACNHLESLAERDETPSLASGPQSNLDSIASSPSAPRTPATTARIKPPLSEMHPSKVHQSTTQEPDSGLRLGFTDMNTTRKTDQPSGLTQQTPSKTGISSPTFDFTFARPGPQLGPEAQRMMDELREEALRIKVKLAAEREEEKRKEGESIGGRKIAQPKGKAGRFSDVHVAEFKKMDSIAGHPSSFRAQPGRFTPVSKTLKRTQSKAQLDDREDMYKKTEEAAENTNSMERLGNTAPAKRARKHVSEDTSSARPVSRDDNKVLPSTPTMSRSQSTMLAAITTPTQASLSRAAGTKKTQIPSLSRSPSKPNLTKESTPRAMTKSATTNNLSSISKSESHSFIQSPSKFDRVKSMLRHPSFSSKKPAAKPTAIPSLKRSPSRPNLDKVLPSVPSTPGADGGLKAVKHVNFTPDTVNKNSATIQNSPSPVKSGIPRSTSKINLGSRLETQLPSVAKSNAMEMEYPSVSCLPKLGKPSNPVEYPSLSSVRPLPPTPRQAPPPSAPGTFTFRSDHTINFGASPGSFGSSPGQASVRQVRRSVLPSTMPGSFPSGNKENTAPLPSVPHGMSNKKRRRVESDDEAEEDSERSPKKSKTAAGGHMQGHMLFAPKLQATPKPQTPSPAKKKGVMSLSRLNMLARPKMRK
ncbi:hypothetical protein WAI453_001031 [Rhynchosporium graminicola]|uniref:Related to glucan 1,4-alpha-glucosidase n=1 Tax=Rhynchosporium graminicola TaxID=2792576 RepID=A0A1E1K5Z2_9HELO|nr:related to glucan 1,4-alpha-glucosidase [Rhynchosporium commune]